MTYITEEIEQNNGLVKDSGGAIGLTENPAALKRWIVSGHVRARLLSEFEDQYTSHETGDSQNHEQGASTQQLVKTKVNQLCATIHLWITLLWEIPKNS